MNDQLPENNPFEPPESDAKPLKRSPVGVNRLAILSLKLSLGSKVAFFVTYAAAVSMSDGPKIYSGSIAFAIVFLATHLWGLIELVATVLALLALINPVRPRWPAYTTLGFNASLIFLFCLGIFLDTAPS
jgi:hypothetical protein